MMFVITKAGGNRPDESLATLCQKKVLHSISLQATRADNPETFPLSFLILFYVLTSERLAHCCSSCLPAGRQVPAFCVTR